MKKTCLPAVIMIMLASACNKKKEAQFSNWQVNNESFSTNKTSMTINKSICDLSSESKENGFIFFSPRPGVAYTPTPDIYTLSADYTSMNPDLYHAAFFYKGSYYYIYSDQTNALTISNPNGKYCYTLKPCWFTNRSNATDTILISGTFNQP